MSQDELVDIIDQEGNKLKVTTKQEAHSQGLLHKTVISEVIDSQGRWLMVKQSKDRQDAGQYVSPVGGHVSAGETEIEALKREAQEEVGLTGNFKHHYIGRAVFNRHVIGRQENHLFVMYSVFSDAKPVLSNESESCKYFTREELTFELKNHPELFGDSFHFVVKNFHQHLHEPRTH